MEKFFRFKEDAISTTFHPILLSRRLLSSLLSIHPDYDGNGRVSRAYMYSFLLTHGYPPMVFDLTDSKLLTSHYDLVDGGGECA